MKNLSYEQVEITRGFFRNYIKQMICKVIPTAIKNVEIGGGGMANIKNAAKMHRNEDHDNFQGMFYVDSDVHKVLESMCYALKITPMGDEDLFWAQKQIFEKLEEWIPYYVDAQEDSGYFDTYYTLNKYPKFSDVQMHELYCMGHFIEAAIAHYQYTNGKDTRLFDMATKCADYLCATFGNKEGQLKQISGHQEIELALLKLSRVVADMGDDIRSHKYTDLSIFLLELRGDHKNRTLEGTLPEKYWQDHQKVEEQTEAVGHAVRAQYMYTAMAELASIDAFYRDKYHHALSSLWKDVTYTKQYVTGGIGQSASNEGFDKPYSLPNASAYCETCAGISNMMWNRSMSKLYGGSAFADQIETALYNAVLGCVNLDGDKFYYHNPLESRSGEMRNTWYGTACCPPNLTRTLLSLGEYIYNVSHEAIYVNQFISNIASVSLEGKAVGISMTSSMPWHGNTQIALSMATNMKFKLVFRVPHWTNKVTISINGKTISTPEILDGYITLYKDWSNGDKIELDFSMPVLFEETSEKVTTNIGYTSIRRGPLVYCAEGADNSFNINLSYIDKSATQKLVWIDSIDGKEDPYKIKGIYAINLSGYEIGLKAVKPISWTFIPFHARLNRAAGHMTVYVAKEKMPKTITDFAKPSASYTFRGDSPFNLNDGSMDRNSRWTSWRSGPFLQDPWVQYDFEEAVVLKGCEIWWYDDKGGVRLPDSFEIYYKNNETNEFTKVDHCEKYLCPNDHGFITYNFTDVAVTSLRIIIFNSKAAPGIVEWRVIEGKLDNNLS